MNPIWVFFYGSYMNRDVLREQGLVPSEWHVARLHGFDILIQPRANLFRAEPHSVYGVVATATQAELSRLYTHAQQSLGETYLPEAVLTEGLDGQWRPALCYIAPHMEPRPAASDYVERILVAARQLGFPAWYLERLEAFRPER